MMQFFFFYRMRQTGGAPDTGHAKDRERHQRAYEEYGGDIFKCCFFVADFPRDFVPNKKWNKLSFSRYSL